MSAIEYDNDPGPRIYSRKVLAICPECDGDLMVLRVIGGRAGCEYWTMRCVDCGGIHLDILKPRPTVVDSDGPMPAA